MFGYVKTDLPNLFVKDTALYKGIYCGLCKGIGKLCGTNGRFVLSYDLAFLSAFTHNILGNDIKVETEHCILHPFTKRPIAGVDELTLKISALNVILARYKVGDDIIDDKKGRLKKAFISGAYKRAKKSQPQFDEIVKKRYDELLKLERENSDSIDMVADPFGNMMADIVRNLSGEKFTEEIYAVSYNLGKWVYLIDALDDYDQDIKKKRFNPFYNSYKAVDKKTLINERQSELVFIFGSILSAISENARNIKYQFNHDLIDNVLMRGLGAQTKRIMENEKCKNSTKF